MRYTAEKQGQPVAVDFCFNSRTDYRQNNLKNKN